MELEKNTLYLVATPIGNLGDMTYRAVEVLSKADFIAAEDTRNSLGLLNHFNIKKPLVSYFEHNKRERGEQIVSRIENGEICALITDAGMPAISDPGCDICELCHDRGIKVSVIPGACAAVCALAASGLGNGRFCFEGFLSTAKKSRREHLERAAAEERTMIFYEAPHKLTATLGDMYEAFGDRRMVMARELTKKFEEIKRTTIKEALEYYTENQPKGEFVLVVDGAPRREKGGYTDEELKERLKGLIASGMRKSEAVADVARSTGEKKNRVYELSIDV